jgi:hypothetical protein
MNIHKIVSADQLSIAPRNDTYLLNRSEFKNISNNSENHPLYSDFKNLSNNSEHILLSTRFKYLSSSLFPSFFNKEERGRRRLSKNSSDGNDSKKQVTISEHSLASEHRNDGDRKNLDQLPSASLTMDKNSSINNIDDGNNVNYMNQTNNINYMNQTNYINHTNNINDTNYINDTNNINDTNYINDIIYMDNINEKNYRNFMNDKNYMNNPNNMNDTFDKNQLSFQSTN